MADRKKQIGGDHYSRHTIQPFDIIDEYGLNFYEGNALKYLLRQKDDRILDLEKAKHYLEVLIDLERADVLRRAEDGISSSKRTET
jgi:hypothetical protein